MNMPPVIISIAVLLITGGILFAMVGIQVRRQRGWSGEREELEKWFSAPEFKCVSEIDGTHIVYRKTAFILRLSFHGESGSLKLVMDMPIARTHPRNPTPLGSLLRVERKAFGKGFDRFLWDLKPCSSGSMSFDAAYVLSAAEPEVASRAFSLPEAKPAAETLFRLGFDTIDREIITLSAVRNRYRRGEITREFLTEAMDAMLALGACLPSAEPSRGGPGSIIS